MYLEVQLDLTPEIEVYSVCRLRDVILKIERYLSNSTSISEVKFSWTTLYDHITISVSESELRRR